LFELRAVRDQVLRIRDHDGRSRGVDALAGLCLQFVDESAVLIRRRPALAGCPRCRGGFKLGSNEFAWPLA
jgi:hypothetical protein